MKRLLLALTAAACCLMFTPSAEATHGFLARAVVARQRARIQQRIHYRQNLQVIRLQQVHYQPVQRIQAYYAPQPVIVERQTQCYSAPLVQEYVAPQTGCTEFFRTY